MQVYLSEHIAPSAYARLARHFEIVDNFDHPEQLAAMIIRRAVVPRTVIARAPNLKVIAMHGVSRDTIDTAAAAEFGVPVPNVPGLGAPAVAELAVADLLARNRQLKFVINGLCAGRFDHFGAEEFVCHEMTGRTLGLVGTGNIAHRVADILRAAFDVRVLCWNPRRTAAECAAPAWGSDPRHVDYGKIYESRLTLLHKAYKRGWERDSGAVADFTAENERWLPDYALYMACKRHFGMKAWTEWPDDDLRLRKNEAVLDKYRTLLREDVQFFTYLQFLFFRQWTALRDYVHQQGIRIIGDLPIYVAMDSADVWAEPQFFQLDDDLVPKAVAGVPPDYFTADGQLWGNPRYDWDAMRDDGFGWWIRRIDGAGKLYDVIRIAHFRGFANYWAVPYGQPTAKNGRWIAGPGMDLIERLNGWFPQLEFIAEDLGYPTPEVAQLLRESGWPGMKVLEFAFDSRDSSGYLPHA